MSNPSERQAGHIPGPTGAQSQPPGRKDHLRSWTVKTRVSAGLSCGLTSRHRPSNQSENSLETRQSPGLAHGRGLGRAERRLVSITTGARRGSPCGPKLCRPLTPPGAPGLLTVRLPKSRTQKATLLKLTRLLFCFFSFLKKYHLAPPIPPSGVSRKSPQIENQSQSKAA